LIFQDGGGRDIAIIRIFKMAAAAVLYFLKLQISNSALVMSFELRHRAKFRGDRSNRCRDIAIYGFFKMAAAAILDC